MNEHDVKELLKSVAAADDGLAAQDRVEVRVLAAFHAHRIARGRRRFAMLGCAAAAVVFVVITVARRTPDVAAPPMIANTAAPVAPQPESEGIEGAAASISPRISHSNPIAAGKTVTSAAESRKLAPPVATSNSSDIPTAAVAATPREVVTEFFPLMAPAPPLERAAILRVMVPASAMQAVGLPVREERLDDRVEADVVVGEEGLPRAIRFVTFPVKSGPAR